jgi:hypothetical protein
MRCEVCQLQPTKCSATTQKLTRARTQKRPLSENRALSIRNNSVKRKQRTGRARAVQPAVATVSELHFSSSTRHIQTTSTRHTPLHFSWNLPARRKDNTSRPKFRTDQTPPSNFIQPARRVFRPRQVDTLPSLGMIKTVQRVVHFRIYIPLLTWPEATKWPF